MSIVFNIDATDSRVKAALDKITALKELSATTGVQMYRTINELLASLEPPVLAAVAVELKIRKVNMNRYDNPTR